MHVFKHKHNYLINNICIIQKLEMMVLDLQIKYLH
jgi:hypothetical protein